LVFGDIPPTIPIPPSLIYHPLVQAKESLVTPVDEFGSKCNFPRSFLTSIINNTKVREGYCTCTAAA
jgi:hypothetical protein